MLVRDADPARDGAACAAIYAPYVTGAATSFEEIAPGAGAMTERIVAAVAEWPWLVAEVDGAVAAYALAGPHRARGAYRWAADVSVYVDAGHHRRGLGRALYEPLLALLAAQGLRQACAGIALPNPASVALHEALGFTPVGVYRRIGYKHGRWWDVGWWQRPLPACGGDADPPAPPGPPIRLDRSRHPVGRDA